MRGADHRVPVRVGVRGGRVPVAGGGAAVGGVGGGAVVVRRAGVGVGHFVFPFFAFFDRVRKSQAMYICKLCRWNLHDIYGEYAVAKNVLCSRLFIYTSCGEEKPFDIIAS